jgi:hypothetical protein
MKINWNDWRVQLALGLAVALFGWGVVSVILQVLQS